MALSWAEYDNAPLSCSHSILLAYLACSLLEGGFPEVPLFVENCHHFGHELKISDQTQPGLREGGGLELKNYSRDIFIS